MNFGAKLITMVSSAADAAGCGVPTKVRCLVLFCCDGRRRRDLLWVGHPPAADGT